MTDNEIIKALECWLNEIIKSHQASIDLGYENIATDTEEYICLLRETLDLINRQKAEIERLNSENKAFGEIIKKQDDEISGLRRELLSRKNLEESFSKSVKQFDKKLAKTVKLERAEAIKEFEENAVDQVEKARSKYQRLCKEQGEEMEEHMHTHFNGIIKIINDIKKEKVGDV